MLAAPARTALPAPCDAGWRCRLVRASPLTAQRPPAQFDAAIELYTRAMRPPLEPWADAALSVKRSGAFARCVCAVAPPPRLRPLQSAS